MAGLSVDLGSENGKNGVFRPSNLLGAHMNTPIGHKLFQHIPRRVAKFRENRPRDVENLVDGKKIKLECGPMPNVMVALPNTGGALCSTPQSLADAHY